MALSWHFHPPLHLLWYQRCLFLLFSYKRYCNTAATTKQTRLRGLQQQKVSSEQHKTDPAHSLIPTRGVCPSSVPRSNTGTQVLQPGMTGDKGCWLGRQPCTDVPWGANRDSGMVCLPPCPTSVRHQYWLPAFCLCVPQGSSTVLYTPTIIS